jgi:PAS domain S-box-containing protein
LSTLFASPVVGVAVLDSRMRFRAINGALAAMNGMPAADHVGKTLRHVIGAAAPKVESTVDQVFRTGEPVSLEVTAELPRRTALGHWMESVIPIRDVAGRVTQVAAVVLEVTEKRDLERSLNPVVGNLLQIRAALKNELELQTRIKLSDERSELFERSINLAEQCIATVQGLCGIPRFQSSSGQSQVPLDVNHNGNEVRARALSPRERGVLRLLADGKNNKEVGVSLGISVRTAECYRARLMRKVEIHSLAHLVRFAVRNKIVDL